MVNGLERAFTLPKATFSLGMRITKKLDNCMDTVKKRCFGNGPGQDLYADYHDKEWGVPIHEDRQLFEMLILEGAQAGLSWEIVLKKREHYRNLFYNFEPSLIAEMRDADLEALVNNPAIIRNRRKIFGIRQNARVFLKIQKELSSFNSYLWQFVNHTPLINDWKTLEEVPSRSIQSDLLSKDLKKRGMVFVGSTIIYAYMQAIGMVNDHLVDCFCRPKERAT